MLTAVCDYYIIMPIRRKGCSKAKTIRKFKSEIKANYRPEEEELSWFFLPVALTTNGRYPLQQNFRLETVISKTRPSTTLKEIPALPELEEMGLWQKEFARKRFFTWTAHRSIQIEEWILPFLGVCWERERW